MQYGTVLTPQSDPTPPGYAVNPCNTTTVHETDLSPCLSGRYNPEVEPPRALAAAETDDATVKGYSLKRGSVARLKQDKLRSKF